MAKNQSVKTGKKLRGAVLIMVLTVSFMLIILLLATLTVVSTAQNRTYDKYVENQAYYTARSALDIYTERLLNDNEYKVYNSSGATIEKYKYTDRETDPANPTIEEADLTQGLDLQLDLYKTKAKNNFDGTDYSSEFWGNPLESQEVFGKVGANSAPENKNFGVVYDKLEYQVSFPAALNDTTTSSGKYGRFVDVDSATAEHEATITVEVIERIYDTGGKYTLADLKLGTIPDADLKEAIMNGNRAKDHMLLKVTSTIEYMGETGTAVVYYGSEYKEVAKFKNAVTSFSGVGNNNMTVLGGLALTDSNSSTNNTHVYGGYYAGANHTSTGNTMTVINLARNEVSYIANNFDAKTGGVINIYNKENNVDNSTVPCLYVGGEFKMASSFSSLKIGDNSGAVREEANMVLNMLTIDNPSASAKYEQYGNLYIVGATSDLSADYINNGVGTSPMDNAAALNTNGYSLHTIQVDGDIFIRGSVDLTKVNFDNCTGGIYIDGNVISDDVVIDKNGEIVLSNQIKPNMKITGEIYKVLSVAGTTKTCDTYVESNHLLPGGVYAKAEIVESCAAYDYKIDSVGFDWTDIDKSGIDETSTAEEIIYPIVSSGAGGDSLEDSSVKKIIPTHLSVYYDYYKNDASGSMITPYEVISAEEYVYYKEDDHKKGIYDTMTDFSAPTDEDGNAITMDGAIGRLDSLTINSGETKYYTFAPTNSTGDNGGLDCNINISGGGTIYIFLSPGSYGGKINVDDKTTVIVCAPTGQYYWGVALLNAQIGSASDVILGNVDFAVKAPKINYFFSSGVEWNFMHRAQMIGYIYGPDATMNSAWGNQTPSLTRNWKYYYNDKDYAQSGIDPGHKNFVTIGAMVIGDSNMGSNNCAIGYIKPESDNSTPGEAILNWKPAVYARG